MRIGITGATGLIGTALVPALAAAGHEPVRFVRSAPSGTDRVWDAKQLGPDSVQDLEAVVHLAGAGVGDKRWSPAYKKLVLESRTVSTAAVASAVAQAGVPVLLSGSAIGYYGHTGDEILDESSIAGDTFLADVCVQWERATARADDKARVVHLRTGIVQSRTGGALKKQLPIFKAGAGAPLGSGDQWVSWIALEDEVRAITHLLTADVRGPVNLTAPEPVRNRDYTRALGKAVHRPTLPIGIPKAALQLALGGFAEEVVRGQRVVPGVLESSGYAFRVPDLGSALQD
ncbi:MAG: hypothetical protein JWO22_1790 [Frankiales bacterium]|nr:hypothetical protein [Frankiales bacterium]